MKCINLLNRILLTISNGKYFKNYVFYRKLHLSEVKIVNELMSFFLDLLETCTNKKTAYYFYFVSRYFEIILNHVSCIRIIQGHFFIIKWTKSKLLILFS